jgi:hypothetical protein
LYINAPQNLIDLEKGPLREYLSIQMHTQRYLILCAADEVVAALDAAWEMVKPTAAVYYH